MRRSKLLAFLLLVAALVLVGSSLSNPSPASAQGPTPPEITLSEKDEGRQIDLVEGQSLAISLAANPSTGYRWQTVEVNPALLLQTQKARFRPGLRAIDSTQPIVGAPGIQVMRFAALAAGLSELRFVYRRPWEKNEPPLKSYALKVNAVGSFTQAPPSVLPENEEPASPQPQPEISPSQAPPASLNWCSANNPKGSNRCTPVRNQGSCGSCWSFGMLGAVEAAIKIRDNVDRDGAEQYLINCNSEGYGCNGGWWIYDYFVNKIPTGQTAAGLRYETDLPYQAAKGACTAAAAYEKLIDWKNLDDTAVDAIKKAVLDYGPVSVAVCVGTAFQEYSGGVFQTNEATACNSNVNHAVVITGWDDADGAWIIRNSWGPAWGESGSMRIKYGTSNVGFGPAYVVYGGQASNYSISGFVRTAGGVGINDVTVSFGGARPDVTTNSSGLFNQSGFANGAYTVSVDKANYTFNPTTQNVTVNGADVGNVNFTGTQAAGLYNISGFVRDASNVGISGVTVSFGAAGPAVTTDNTGFFVQDGFANGDYTVSASLDGYNITPTSQTATVNGADVSNVNFTGTRPTYTISGFVRDANGAAISGVTMSFGADRPAVATDNNGFYSQSGFPNGHPVVTPSKTGFTFDPPSRRLTMASANLENVDFTGTSQTYSIRGTVKTANGAAINGVTLSFGGARPAVKSDDTGYVQSGFANGTYTVTVSLNGYTFDPPQQVVTVNNGDVMANFTGSPQPNFFSISGRAQTGTGTVLNGVSISFGGARPPVKTDSSGAYTQTAFTNGTYTLMPSLSGYAFVPASQSVTVQGRDVSNVVFVGTQQTYAISGRITSAGSGITATIYFSGGLATTADRNGYYTRTGLLNGSYIVAPSRAEYDFSPPSQNIVVNGSDVANVNFTASPPSYCVSGYVRTENGTGIGGVIVSFTNALSTTTNASGFYARCGVPYGPTTVRPTRSAYSFNPTARSIGVIRDMPNVDFTAIATSFSIAGRVTMANGAGIANVPVYFSQGYEFTTSDSNGYYTQTGFTSNTYVQPVRTGYSFNPASRDVVATGGNFSGVDFVGTRQSVAYAISGFVRDSNGKAIPGATIRFSNGYSTTSNSQGLYILDVFTTSVTASASHPAFSFTPSSQNVPISGSDVNNVNFTGTQTQAFMLGRVLLQGHFDPPSPFWLGYPLTVQVYTPTATSPISTASANSDASGYFILSGIAPGNYDIKVKNPHSLSAKRANVAVSSNVVVNFGVLREGDTTNDDKIWYEDYDVLAAAFGTCPGDAKWDGRADVDDSGCVWLYDASLLVTNFGSGGQVSVGGPPSTGTTDSQVAVRDTLTTRQSALKPAPSVSALLTANPSSAASEFTRISLDPPLRGSVAVGSVFAITVKVQPGTRGLDGVGVFLDFDPSILEVVDSTGVMTSTTIEAGATLPRVLLNRVDQSNGYIDFSAIRQLASTPVTANFDLATIRFRLKKLTNNTVIRFDNQDPHNSLTDAFLEGYSVLDLTAPLQGSTISGALTPRLYLPLIRR